VTRVDINNRFAGSEQRVFWTDHAVVCQAPSREHRGLSLTEIKAAINLLADAGCMDTPQLVDCPSDGLAFRWERVGKLTYAWEWPAEGWRAAARVALRALQVLKDINLTLVDLQPSDFFMAGTRPFLANLFAVGQWSEAREAVSLEQIERYFIRPVTCAVHGQAGLARRLLRGSVDGLSARDTNVIVGPRNGNTEDSTRKSVSDVVASLDHMTMPWHGRRWSWEAYEEDVDRLFPEEAAAKTAIVQSVLSRMKPMVVLDIACNRGRYAHLASVAGAIVTGLDSDEGCMNAFFTRAAEQRGLAAGVVMDIRDPSATRGWGAGWCVPAERRLASECVIVLAVLHHIVLDMKMTAAELRRLFGTLAERWLLVEVAPRGAGHFYNHGSEFYTVDWLLAVLAEQFVKQECWSVGHRGRSIVLLRRL
jgi:hypothetical protein